MKRLCFSLLVLAICWSAYGERRVICDNEHACWWLENTGSYYIGAEKYVCTTISITPRNIDIAIILDPLRFVNNYSLPAGYIDKKNFLWAFDDYFSGSERPETPDLEKFLWKYIDKDSTFTINLLHPAKLEEESILRALRPYRGQEYMKKGRQYACEYRGTAITIKVENAGQHATAPKSE